MNNLILAIERTGQQILDRAFLKVFMLGLLTTVGAIIVAYLAANELLKEIPLYQSDWDWWQDVINWLTDHAFTFIFFFLIAFFFVPISTIFISIFLDDIVDCVEDRFYPHNKAGKRLGVGHLAFLATRLMLLILVLNIIIIPLYIILFWIPFAPMMIFYLLNGYLLGWGYYEMVAVRHLGIKEAGVHRKSIRGTVLIGGLIITLLFMVPILNLAAPIIGVALVCHLYHIGRPQSEAQVFN